MRRWALATSLLASACSPARDVVAELNVPQRVQCDTAGAPVLEGGTCTGELAAAVFTRALCACGDVSLAAAVATDGFDSSVAPWAAGGRGADVGVNGGLTSATTLEVGGDAVAVGAIAAGSSLAVHGDLASGSGLTRPASAVVVDGNAWINGNVDVASLTVGGTYSHPPGATTTGTVTAGTTFETTAWIPPPAPCACGASTPLDVAATVAAHRTAHDDVLAGIDPAVLADVSGARTLELPCGRYYLSRIAGTGGVTLRATGRTALFVDQGLSLTGALVIQLAAGAELDLFISGPVNLPPTVALGDTARPRALRIYLDASGSVSFPAGATVAANVFAPNAGLGADGPLELYGAAFVGTLLANHPMTIHRDRAVAQAGAACR